MKNPRLIYSAVALGLSYIAVSFVDRLDLGLGAGVASVIFAVACFAWFMVEEISALRCCDELQRRIQLEALGLAFPASILLLFGLGALQRFVDLPPDGWSYRHIWPVCVLLYFGAFFVAKARYR